MNTKKKLVSVCLAVSLAAIAIVGSSLAYFTDFDSKANDFTIGNVDIRLTEDNWDASGKADADNMYPGERVAKDPVVHNDGKNPAFVRVKVSGSENFNFITAGQEGTHSNWTLHTDGYYYYNTAIAPQAATEALFDQVELKTTVTNNETSSETEQITVKAEAVQSQGAPHSGDTVTIEEIASWFATCGVQN